MHEYGVFPIGDHPATDIDSLIGKLELVPESQALIEHLQAAANYRREGRLLECNQSLTHALGAAVSLPERAVSEEACRTIQALRQKIFSPEPPSSPEVVGGSPESIKLAEFFSNADVSFGILFPKKHIVAVFLSPAQAEKGLAYLRTAGLRVWEAIVVSGDEVLQFLEELQANEVLWSTLTKELARLPGSQPGTVNAYARWAERGAGFLIAHSPTGEDAEHTTELLGEAGPVAVHYYTAGYIREMT